MYASLKSNAMKNSKLLSGLQHPSMCSALLINFRPLLHGAIKIAIRTARHSPAERALNADRWELLCKSCAATTQSRTSSGNSAQQAEANP